MNHIMLMRNVDKLSFILLMLVCSLVHAVVELRNQEIAECSEGEIKTWEDNRDTAAKFSPIVFYYDHTGAPACLYRQRRVRADPEGPPVTSRTTF